jgi:hypothetical protein
MALLTTAQKDVTDVEPASAELQPQLPSSPAPRLKSAPAPPAPPAPPSHVTTPADHDVIAEVTLRHVSSTDSSASGAARFLAPPRSPVASPTGGVLTRLTAQAKIDAFESIFGVTRGLCTMAPDNEFDAGVLRIQLHAAAAPCISYLINVIATGGALPPGYGLGAWIVDRLVVSHPFRETAATAGAGKQAGQSGTTDAVGTVHLRGNGPLPKHPNDLHMLLQVRCRFIHPFALNHTLSPQQMFDQPLNPTAWSDVTYARLHDDVEAVTAMERSKDNDDVSASPPEWKNLSWSLRLGKAEFEAASFYIKMPIRTCICPCIHNQLY